MPYKNVHCLLLYIRILIYSCLSNATDFENKFQCTVDSQFQKYRSLVVNTIFWYTHFRWQYRFQSSSSIEKTKLPKKKTFQLTEIDMKTCNHTLTHKLWYTLCLHWLKSQ